MDVEVPDGAAAIAVLLHPHPDMGGDRYNHVIGALYRRLPEVGVGAARFDFSTSDMTAAATETVDAIDRVVAAHPDLPIVLVGYSFGALVAMQVPDARLRGWFLVAPPIDHSAGSTLPADARPKGIAVAEHDVYAPPARVAEAAASWSATDVRVVPDADHFLAGATDTVVTHVNEWISSVIGGPGAP
jgi:hypothetical protein